MDIIEAIAADLKKSKYIVAFTGAGISSESGIPTYRGEDGLWTKYDPNLYANIHYFRQNPSYYWNFFQEVRGPMLKTVKPNKAHLALADLEKAGKMNTVITQNIDGLHQEAGSSTVVELHGTSRTITCMDCSREYLLDEAISFLETECPPLCEQCQGVLRPAVIFFGESLDPRVLRTAYEEVGQSDFVLAVGSSLVVYPAADLPVRAKQGEATLVIINKDETPLDHLADYVINDAAGKVLPSIVERLMLAE